MHFVNVPYEPSYFLIRRKNHVTYTYMHTHTLSAWLTVSAGLGEQAPQPPCVAGACSGPCAAHPLLFPEARRKPGRGG